MILLILIQYLGQQHSANTINGKCSTQNNKQVASRPVLCSIGRSVLLLISSSFEQCFIEFKIFLFIDIVSNEINIHSFKYIQVEISILLVKNLVWINAVDVDVVNFLHCGKIINFDGDHIFARVCVR